MLGYMQYKACALYASVYGIFPFCLWSHALPIRTPQVILSSGQSSVRCIWCNDTCRIAILLFARRKTRYKKFFKNTIGVVYRIISFCKISFIKFNCSHLVRYTPLTGFSVEITKHLSLLF